MSVADFVEPVESDLAGCTGLPDEGHMCSGQLLAVDGLQLMIAMPVAGSFLIVEAERIGQAGCFVVLATQLLPVVKRPLRTSVLPDQNDLGMVVVGRIDSRAEHGTSHHR